MRRPFLIAVLTLTAVLTAAFGVDAWLLLTGRVNATLLPLLLAAEFLLLIGALWALYALLELRLLRPLAMLKDQFKILAHTDSNHRVDLPDKHLLGELAQCAEEVGLALVRTRRETAKAMESAADRVDRRKARLEAILRDLTEGVVVCTLDHRVVLFNQAASSLLQDAGALGLHRFVTPLFRGDAVARELAGLLEQHEAGQRHPRIDEFECRLAGSTGGSVAVRMNLIIETDGGVSGYVLSLTGKGALRFARTQESEASVLSDRPEFYDFTLFDRDTATELMERPLAELDYVVFDTETTGLNPSAGDEIVQIAGVRVVNNRVLAGDQFDLLVNPGFPIPRQSVRFHGITDDMVTAAPAVCEALARFHTFAENAVLVAHNAAFDMKFLRMKEANCGLEFTNPVLDTLLLSYVLQPSHTAHTLDAIAARFGVDIAAEIRHTALGDSQATAEVFVQMLGALDNQGVRTLREAIEATNQVFEIRKLQEQF